MDYLKKINALGKALESRPLDDAIITHFNDVHTEAEKTEKYIEELEWQNFHTVKRLRKHIEFIVECQRLRAGIVRNIKQLRAARGYKGVVINTRNNG